MAVEMVEDEGEWQKKQMDLFTCVFIRRRRLSARTLQLTRDIVASTRGRSCRDTHLEWLGGGQPSRGDRPITGGRGQSRPIQRTTVSLTACRGAHVRGSTLPFGHRQVTSHVKRPAGCWPVSQGSGGAANGGRSLGGRHGRQPCQLMHGETRAIKRRRKRNPMTAADPDIGESLSVQETALGRSSSGQVPKVEYGAEGGGKFQRDNAVNPTDQERGFLASVLGVSNAIITLEFGYELHECLSRGNPVTDRPPRS
ncbi:hypothetical protein F4824DRAFT_498155 [Ustulina deusta]|nr:hypothetical protein F4824DRAFT_498155 [Ustulina deusta]